MKHTLSCRTGIFGSPEVSFPALVAAGVVNGEVDVPKDGNYVRLKQLADKAGLTIATLSTGCNVDDPASVKAFEQQIAGAGQIGVPTFFCSLQSAQPESPAAIATLTRLADVAAEQGVTLAMETHPPFGTNAGTALRTIEAVNRPNFRYNFDTANLYYYNRGLDSVNELKRCREHVASVHLKESTGGYHVMAFPILGQGIVDFPAIFRLLDEVGFAGPYTMELEGKDLDDHAGGKEDFLQRCIGHLREIGAIG